MKRGESGRKIRKNSSCQNWVEEKWRREGKRESTSTLFHPLSSIFNFSFMHKQTLEPRKRAFFCSPLSYSLFSENKQAFINLELKKKFILGSARKQKYSILLRAISFVYYEENEL